MAGHRTRLTCHYLPFFCQLSSVSASPADTLVSLHKCPASPAGHLPLFDHFYYEVTRNHIPKDVRTYFDQKGKDKTSLPTKTELILTFDCWPFTSPPLKNNQSQPTPPVFSLSLHLILHTCHSHESGNPYQIQRKRISVFKKTTPSRMWFFLFNPRSFCHPTFLSSWEFRLQPFIIPILKPQAPACTGQPRHLGG